MRPKKEKIISDVQQEIEVTTTQSKDANDSDKDQTFGKLMIDEREEKVIPSSTKSREPKCAKCRNHGLTVPKKSHKGFCEYEPCICPKCRNIDERRLVLRNQLKIRRQLEIEEKGLIPPKRQVYRFGSHSVRALQVPIQVKNEVKKPSVSSVPMDSSLQSHPYQYSQISYLTESSNPESLSTSSTSQHEFQESPIDMSHKYSENSMNVSQIQPEYNAYYNNYYEYQVFY